VNDFSVHVRFEDKSYVSAEKTLRGSD